VPLARHLLGPALLVATAALLAGCAQPGQLGHESDAVPSASAAPAPTTETALPGVPDVPVTQAGSDARGRLDRPVDISTPGPAELLVRTEVLQPGQASGWVRHPGTVISVVRSGTVTVQRADSCEPRPFGPGEAFFLEDGRPNELRNDGPDPVVLTRSELLAPGAPEREPAEPAC
jgi:quercetin dioxygenase-like cupin family protein